MRSLGTSGSRIFLSPPPALPPSIAGPAPFVAVAFTPKLTWPTWVPSRRRLMVSSRGVRCQLRQQAAPIHDTKSTSEVDTTLDTQGLKERIKLAIANVTLSASPFDIAWVAMVPSPNSHAIPCFPECIEWILQNQNVDGSWGLNGNYKYLVKDAMSSTLACILSLKRWNIGGEFIRRGLEFVGHHSSFLIDDKQYSPMGFSVIFSMMIQHTKQLGLDIPISEDILSKLYVMRDIDLESERRNTTHSQWISYLGYIAEGTDPVPHYDEVIRRYQKNNGSLFNSPSSTAALLIHLHDEKAMNYLQNVVHTCGGAVPTVYPSNMCARLCMVDSLEKLGIAHHFNDYIRNVLDETYRAWLQNEEELYSEIFTHALAFRLLRMHGHDISFGVFNEEDVDEQLSFKNNSYPKITTVLELYKASQLEIYHDENSLKKLKSWSTDILTQFVSKYTVHNDFEKHIIEEVEHNLNFPFYKCLECLEHRRNIETYNTNIVKCQKSSFMYHNIDGANILKLAIDDFNFDQLIYQKELYHLKRWFQEKKLDQLAQFGVNGLVYSYLSAVTGVIPIECYDARIALTKNGLFITILDEFFDVISSAEERDNLVDLCRRWDSNYKSQCCSEKVYIIFDALYTTIEEISSKASSIHGYNVTSHMIELWVEYINAMNKEAEWQRNMIVPSFEEYIDIGTITFGIGVMLSTIFFLGEKLSSDIMRSQECQQLYTLVGLCGRLINDISGYERDKKENKIASIGLLILNEDGITSEEDAKSKIWNTIEDCRNKLSMLVFKNNESVVPRGCKQVLWDMCRLLLLFYYKIDGLRSNNSMVDVKLIIDEPITICS